MKQNKPCVYLATNSVNGMVYIGKTTNLHRRMTEHKGHAKKDGGNFHAAIIEYGFNVFSFEVLEYCEPDEADDREIFYIAKYRSELGDENVYNVTKGGVGGQTHDISGKNNPQYGRKWTDAEKQRVREKLIGRKKPPDFGKKVSERLKGKPKSHEATLKRCLPISVIDIHTGEVRTFESRSQLRREAGIDSNTILRGGISRGRYKLYIPD